MKTSLNDFIKREFVANMVKPNKVTFLSGLENLKDRKTSISFTRDTLKFDEKEKDQGAIHPHQKDKMEEDKEAI